MKNLSENIRSVISISNFILNIVSIIIFITLIMFIFSKGFSVTNSINSVDLLTIILTSLAVLLTGMAIFIALIGFFGYNSIQEKAMEAAEKKALELIQELKSRTEELDKREESLKFFDNLSSSISDKVLKELKTKKAFKSSNKNDN